VCLDTCHAALQFENLSDVWADYQGAGSAFPGAVQRALAGGIDPRHLAGAAGFDEPVYLHQGEGEDQGGGRVSWYDLPDALRELPDFDDVEELRVAFSTCRSFFRGAGVAITIATLDDDSFFTCCGAATVPHLEIESIRGCAAAEVHPGDV